MLALRSPKGLSGSARKWPVSPPPLPQGPWRAAWRSRADTILSAFLWQKPQGHTQVCLLPEALASPRSPEVTRQVGAQGRKRRGYETSHRALPQNPGQGRDLAEKASASQEIARGDFHPQALW